jgi:hypothetical protein
VYIRKKNLTRSAGLNPSQPTQYASSSLRLLPALIVPSYLLFFSMFSSGYTKKPKWPAAKLGERVARRSLHLAHHPSFPCPHSPEKLATSLPASLVVVLENRNDGAADNEATDLELGHEYQNSPRRGRRQELGRNTSTGNRVV